MQKREVRSDVEDRPIAQGGTALLQEESKVVPIRLTEQDRDVDKVPDGRLGAGELALDTEARRLESGHRWIFSGIEQSERGRKAAACEWMVRYIDRAAASCIESSDLTEYEYVC